MTTKAPYFHATQIDVALNIPEDTNQVKAMQRVVSRLDRGLIQEVHVGKKVRGLFVVTDNGMVPVFKDGHVMGARVSSAELRERIHGSQQ